MIGPGAATGCAPAGRPPAEPDRGQSQPAWPDRCARRDQRRSRSAAPGSGSRPVARGQRAPPTTAPPVAGPPGVGGRRRADRGTAWSLPRTDRPTAYRAGGVTAAERGGTAVGAATAASRTRASAAPDPTSCAPVHRAVGRRAGRTAMVPERGGRPRHGRARPARPAAAPRTRAPAVAPAAGDPGLTTAPAGHGGPAAGSRRRQAAPDPPGQPPGAYTGGPAWRGPGRVPPGGGAGRSARPLTGRERRRVSHAGSVRTPSRAAPAGAGAALAS